MSNTPVNVDFSQGGNSVFENVYITGILDAASSTGVGGGGFSGDSLTIPGNLDVTGISTFVGNVDVNNLLVRENLDIGVGGTFLNASVETQRIGIGTTMPTSMLQIGTGGSNSTIVTAGGTVGIGSTDPYGWVSPQDGFVFEGPSDHSGPGYASTEWTCPPNVTSVSIVCIGGGGGGTSGTSENTTEVAGGGGGGLAYKTSYTVVPGQKYLIRAGAGGQGGDSTGTGADIYAGFDGGDSIFYNDAAGSSPVCSAEGGEGGTPTHSGGGNGGDKLLGDGGGEGGQGGDADGERGAAGGGAAGYTAAGGHGGNGDDASGAGNGEAAISGGGGGGGGQAGEYQQGGAGGGGVGVYGKGSDGTAGTEQSGTGGADSAEGGGGGSGGQDGSDVIDTGQNGGWGGYYGGGGGSGARLTIDNGGWGGRGVVRVIWGPGRSYPNTLTGAEYDWGSSGNLNPSDGPFKLDIVGSVHIGKNIYDSAGGPGANGYYLARDLNGIRWQQASPVSLEGLYVQDSGTTLPSGGTAQLFTYLNFDISNSLGVGTDNVVAVPDPDNPTAIAKIQIQDYWGNTGSDIYRMSKVGVQNNAPTQTFEVSSGTNSFVVTDTGKVGIKTDSPYTPLMLQVGSGEGSISRNFVVTGNGSDWGRVGIGTTFPKDSYHLDVHGAAKIEGNALIRGNITLTGDNKTFIIEKEDGTNKFTVSSQTGNTDIEGTLGVKGNTDIEGNLDVEGTTAINSSTNPTSSSDGAALKVVGGATIGQKVFIGGVTKIESAQDSTSKIEGALVVSGGVGIGLKLNVGEDLTIGNDLSVGNNLNVDGNSVLGSDISSNTTSIKGSLTVQSIADSTTTGSGALVVSGGAGIAKNATIGLGLDVGGNVTVGGISAFVGSATFDNEVGIGKTLELGSHIKDINDTVGVGVAKTDYRLASVGTGVSWRPSGVQTKNAIWVSMNGMDSNSGLLEGDAKRTIGGAAAIAQAGDTIIVRSGVYYENNPVGLRTEVTVSGEDLRLVTVVPNNVNKDVFQVRAGCLIQNLNFAGQTSTTNHPNCGAVAFPPTSAGIAGGTDYQAVTGYTALGPANQGPDRVDPSKGARYRSPYVRNCTNFMTGSVGMKINGDYVNAAFTGTNDLGQDLKSMVCDSFTQYNQAGIGVSIINNAYAQLVSIFTIGCDIAIFAGSGGQCDLTNSNSSFGNFGLKADGIGDVEFTGSTDTASISGQDTIAITNVKDTSGNIRKPFDGQGAYFKINLDNYDDAIGSDTITQPLQFIRSIDVINGGSGYSQGAPPAVTIPPPEGPEATLPEFSANVGTDGSITSIDVISSGRNFVANQDFTVTFSSGDATAKVNTDPILYTVSESSEPNTITGLTNVTFNEFIPYSLESGVDVEFSRLSRIITSSHSFEYVGAGTDLNRANPFQGGEPIPENEIVAINGGQIPFTSTDQKGNFRIGEGLTIDQTTSTITGRDFNRAIQAQLTPLILALR